MRPGQTAIYCLVMPRASHSRAREDPAVEIQAAVVKRPARPRAQVIKAREPLTMSRLNRAREKLRRMNADTQAPLKAVK